MTRYDDMMARLRAGERVLIDGGTGTEAERRGVPQLPNAWNGGGALSHPEIVRDIHVDYIRAGAELIITNSFGCARHALADAGEEARFDEYNRRATEIADEARDAAGRPGTLVAGGISYWSWTGRYPETDAIEADIARQAGVMKDAGADMLILEMMVNVARTRAALAGAAGAGLPVWAGISCAPAGDGTMRLMDGEPIEEALDVLAAGGVPVVCVMHTDVALIDACLDIVLPRWEGPVGVYAHSGVSDDGRWTFERTMPPAPHAALARHWLDRGVQVVGGCCGMHPGHVEAIAGRMG